MKTLEQFKEFCETTLKPQLEPLENERIATKNNINSKLVIMVIIYLMIGACLYTMMMYNPESFMKVMAVVSVAYIFICSLIIGSIYKKYNMNFKDTVVKEIITFLDPNLLYNQTNYMSEGQFRFAELYKDRIDKYSGEDYVQGTIYDEEYEAKTGEKKGTKIEFSELHVIKVVTTTDKDGRTRKHDETVFKGLFFKADFNKNFNSKIIVMPDRGIFNFIHSYEKIKLEDAEFEKYFEVCGTNQIEARYILTPSLMRRIVEYKRKNNKDMRLSFIDGHVYITISYGRNLFEANVYKSLFDFGEMEQYFEDLLVVIGIVEELNLNTKIWSKE